MLIKVGDTVQVMRGEDKGERGKVLRVDEAARKVLIEGINRVFKHVRRSQKNPQGGRLEKEMPVSVSNVMLLDPNSGQPTRVGVRYLDDGSKERYAKKSGASLGVISPPRPRYAKN
jgi:large subunit ribosomal protein L24